MYGRNAHALCPNKLMNRITAHIAGSGDNHFSGDRARHTSTPITAKTINPIAR